MSLLKRRSQLLKFLKGPSMFHYKKHSIAALALLLSGSIFAADFTNEEMKSNNSTISHSSTAEITQEERIDLFNAYYVMTNPGKEHTEEDLASYHRFLSAKSQPEKPQNVPDEAYFTTGGFWHITTGTKVIDAWNPDGTLSQPLYAWWVYFGTYAGATAANDYHDFITAYKNKFSGVHVNEELFKSVVAPYQQVSTIFPKSGYREPEHLGYGPAAIDSFLNEFMQKVAPAASTENIAESIK